MMKIEHSVDMDYLNKKVLSRLLTLSMRLGVHGNEIYFTWDDRERC